MGHGLQTDDAMIYVGERPWHGLGRRVRQNMTEEEFLKAAKLDWNIEVRPMHVPGLTMIEKKNMLVRPPVYKGETEDVCLDLVGSRFKPVQNADAASVFRDFVKAGKMQMETAGALEGGQYVWFLAKTTDAFSLAGGDEVRGYFLLVSPHKMGQAFVAKLTATRVVCMNTMCFALNDAALNNTEWRMRHSRVLDADAIEEMKITLGLKAAMGGFREQAEILANAKMNERDAVRFLAKVFIPEMVVNDNTLIGNIDGNDYKFAMPKTMDAVGQVASELIHGRNMFKRVAKVFFDQPGYDLSSSEGKAWGAFNAITFALDHVFGTNDNVRMFNATMGSSIKVKDRAMSIALDLARAA